ncbi:hypothetical protein F5Y12DRAFT_728102 [Xylaria sp. FL1777]|nr:hypothetical protein F5Y12DRAFT_728102 [Xylaria sp. FL1777]
MGITEENVLYSYRNSNSCLRRHHRGHCCGCDATKGGSVSLHQEKKQYDERALSIFLSLSSTTLSTPVDGQVSSSSLSMPAIIVTETVPLYTTSHSSTFVTLLKTEIQSSSSPTPTPPTTTPVGGRVDVDSETAIVATVFVTQLPPSPTNMIPPQPTVTVTSVPPPNTSPLSQPSPSPINPPTDFPTDSPPDSPEDSPSSRICIGDDGSTYSDPSTGDKFRIECGVAHQGKDIENLKAYTMEACISLCVKNRFCKGAIWFNVGPQGTDLNYCWLKSEMDDSAIQLMPDAQSVVRL